MALLPGTNVARYRAVWGESLAEIAAANGVSPGSIAWASGLDPNWHHLAPLPPGTELLIPLHLVPHRTIVASAVDPRTDPRGQLVFPNPGTVITARTMAMPMPIGI
jgi:hypothetical protein